ncbi:hypothetical protein LTR10_015410 [Elasticomyces elasticus]|uniref:Ilp is an apoptosis inhibitor n=1 Tax=Exophiala sideris TaxID=1016849 RepID=A0ABR0J3S9_9EURO|nr:hypothetical protein LTR10_015410 [Elasticomyces elasticus]KAK5026997.1 hypothetical protein LTS07_007296 [Exophiala sideris]KAK5034001.1 hypothetical protein LTR13_006601 [Exophiala sideris]KAK5055725.1 hypothetical protein LTR69_008100 [Exophiala sideris]KAK5180943.1 hypothetical protein LTR44_006763 [Eurotiomycetes sp. CCFEE 6388]
MAFSSSSSEDNFGPSSRSLRDARFTGINSPSEASSHGKGPEPQFDIISWYPRHQSCQRYFIDHAQHEPLVQTFAAFVNILLPFQRQPNPVFSTTGSRSGKSRLDREVPSRSSSSEAAAAASAVSLIPYIRRLVVTGMDVPQVLHGFFGDDWRAGIGPQREAERRNYLFAAKSGGWASVKRDYDIPPLETVPFMRPLYDPTDGEIEAAERSWSEWLALEDWMVGSRAPEQE